MTLKELLKKDKLEINCNNMAEIVENAQKTK